MSRSTLRLGRIAYLNMWPLFTLLTPALAGRDDLGFGRVDQLRVGPVQVEADHSDRRIAHQIADAIQRGLAANRP